MYELGIDDLEDLALGATFLGTGGGGDPYGARIMLEELIRSGRKIEIISIDELGDDDLIVPVAMVGAPTIAREKIPCSKAGRSALQKMESIKGQIASALIASEIGGSNGLFPMYVAAQAGLPVVDGDGMGRAFPESQMVTFNLAGIDASPAIVADEYGNTVVVDADDPMHIERLVRSVVTSMGGDGCVVDFPMSGKDVRRAAVSGSVSLALSIGRTIRKARTASEDPFQAVSNFLRRSEGRRFADVIFSGKIIDVARETKGGFVFGRARIESDCDNNRVMDIQLKNEYLIATDNKKVVAIVPDLICILERETATPIPTENLKYGQRVNVFAVSAPPELCTSKALEVFGPAAFGLNEKFVALGIN